MSQGPAKVRQRLDQVDDDPDRRRLDDGGFLQESEDTVDTAGRASAGAADREALRAGRDLIDQASKQDRRVLGWARVTDGNPCAFCAMLFMTPQAPDYDRQWQAVTRGMTGAEARRAWRRRTAASSGHWPGT